MSFVRQPTNASCSEPLAGSHPCCGVVINDYEKGKSQPIYSKGHLPGAISSLLLVYRPFRVGFFFFFNNTITIGLDSST